MASCWTVGSLQNNGVDSERQPETFPVLVRTMFPDHDGTGDRGSMAQTDG